MKDLTFSAEFIGMIIYLSVRQGCYFLLFSDINPGSGTYCKKDICCLLQFCEAASKICGKWCFILCPCHNLKQLTYLSASLKIGVTVTFSLFMGFYHNKRFTEIPNHTSLINSPFLKPPSVSHNCQPFKRASIISYTFISHLLTARERAGRNLDKVAVTSLITIKLFSVVVFMGALMSQKISAISA